MRTCMARCDCELIKISREAFENFIAPRPAAFVSFIQVVVHRVFPSLVPLYGLFRPISPASGVLLTSFSTIFSPCPRQSRTCFYSQKSPHHPAPLQRPSNSGRLLHRHLLRRHPCPYPCISPWQPLSTRKMAGAGHHLRQSRLRVSYHLVRSRVLARTLVPTSAQPSVHP